MGVDLIPTGSQMRNPISAGNLDEGLGGGGSHICRKHRRGVDPISTGNLDGGIACLQQT